jgi:uridine kinase
MPSRQAVVDQLVQYVLANQPSQPLRVAIDGPDAAGKTSLADELVAPLRASGMSVIRASIDGFHRPRAARYARGQDSAVGYYTDSFDHDALIRVLLDPLGPKGSRRYQTAVFDHRTDAAVASPTAVAEPNSVLLFDGVFLLRPELRAFWDVTIFLDAPFEQTLARAIERDVPRLGSAAEVEHRYRVRYIPGQELYYRQARPRDFAHVIVDNADLAAPQLIVQRNRCEERRPPGQLVK